MFMDGFLDSLSVHNVSKKFLGVKIANDLLQRQRLPAISKNERRKSYEEDIFRTTLLRDWSQQSLYQWSGMRSCGFGKGFWSQLLWAADDDKFFKEGFMQAESKGTHKPVADWRMKKLDIRNSFWGRSSVFFWLDIFRSPIS
jgi:hypothetical protein